jgi:Holliday junction resolvase-like predicted endonuclease
MKAGLQAEVQAADYLIRSGYNIIDRNWQTKRCEIDIVASKDNRIYFVEVKQRTQSNQGEGYHYVTPAKLKQMAFAAEIWVAHHRYDGEYQLSVVSVDDDLISFWPDIV